MTRERNPQEPKPLSDSAAGSHASPSERDAAPPETPEPTAADAPRKRKRRRKRRSGSQTPAGSPPASEPSAEAPGASREVQPAATAPEEDRGQRREADPADAEAPASARRKKRRGGAKSRRGKRGAEAAAEPGPTAEAEAERHAGGEADNVGRAETVRSAGPAVDGAKPRKRRRKRRRSGANKIAPPSAEGAESRSGGMTPDEELSGEPSAPDKEAPPAPDRPAEARTGAAEQAAADPREREDAAPAGGVKACLYCGEPKPLGDFLRRTGKRSGSESRRGACRDCRKRRRSPNLEAPDAASDPMPPSAEARPHEPLPEEVEAVEAAPKRRVRRPPPEPPADALLEPTREADLRPTRQGTIRMRGRTDKGRRWQQETDLEMARCLVREHAAVLVNRFTIRRLYTNRTFRRYILERDRYTCHFCGEYGDTIDHLLPRAKGGHTTPLNCVCACMLCNQNKADRDLDEFMEDAEPFDAPASGGVESGSPSSP